MSFTELPPDTEPERRRRPSLRLRFAIAFLIGLVLSMGVGAGALYAYDQRYVGHVLPGVRVGAVDLSGLDAPTAADRIRAAYADLATGEIVVAGPDAPLTITYAEIGREVDAEAMAAEAMAIGRDGNPIERVLSDARTAMRGSTIPVRVTYDTQALADRLQAFAAAQAQDPAEASVSMTDPSAFQVVPGHEGRSADASAALAALNQQIGVIDAPARLEAALDVRVLTLAVDTAEAEQARAAAERITARVVLRYNERTGSISSGVLRSWLHFAPTADGGYGPVLDTSQLPALVARLAPRLDQRAVNASFRTTGGRISGVTPSVVGYKTDVAATVQAVRAVLEARAAGPAPNDVTSVGRVTQPALTTGEAQAARPRMRMVSQWTTYFPLSIKNGFGANIWIPAGLIDGYVVAPRAKFDFWDAVGPVTRAKGYKTGGAIINGRTEPQGALAGGICSCSTTLFNAALRGGYQMGARRNHFYYIDRYPLGLDATVFISGSGARQTMSFTNDTDYPVLIRGYRIRKGSAGYVRFKLFSVPTGRTVRFSDPIVRDVRPATDTIQYTSALPAGQTERIEYPVDGKKVTVTRTVRDRNGNVIHRDTYYSNYARITGVTLVGRARAD